MVSSYRTVLLALSTVVLLLFGGYLVLIHEDQFGFVSIEAGSNVGIDSGDTISSSRSIDSGSKSAAAPSIDARLQEMLREVAADPTYSCEYLSAAVRATQRAINRISADWAIDRYPLFRTFMHIPPPSWDIQKAKLVKLLLEAMAVRRGARTGDAEAVKFVAAFSGSSVTAGHGEL